MKKFEAHLFICTNKREGGRECCADKGSAELRDEVKKLCKARPEWKGRVRVNAAGCLDRCSEGIAAVIYPEGRWLEHLKKDDAERVLAELAKILDKP